MKYDYLFDELGTNTNFICFSFSNNELDFLKNVIDYLEKQGYTDRGVYDAMKKELKSEDFCGLSIKYNCKSLYYTHIGGRVTGNFMRNHYGISPQSIFIDYTNVKRIKIKRGGIRK